MAYGKSLSFPELIRKKRDGETLQREDIKHFIQAVTQGSIQDCQIGAFLMAVRLCGMEPEEMLSLTLEMMSSGTVLEWPERWHGLVVDKHSTGGVGDKVSLPLAPALAACGCKVPMISGRGLMHTGGTLDKLESVPGFSVHQNAEQIWKILDEVGCCIIGQTEELVPADKILYAMRDVTATVDSLPLITSSVICKKAAESLTALVLDVKYGSAALYKTLDSARELAQSLVTVGNQMGMNTAALLTKMDCPIGRQIGNSLEVIESLECLKGRGPADLRELVTKTGGYLLCMCQRAETPEHGSEMIAETLDTGSALRKFQAMLEAQGVKHGVAEALCAGNGDYFQVLRHAEYQEVLHAEKEGTVETIQALPLAEVLHELGAGRSKAGEQINPSVGAELLVTVGEHIAKGTPWLRMHYDLPRLRDGQRHTLQAALVISDCPPFTAGSRITEILTPEGMRWGGTEELSSASSQHIQI
ncbi:thymidine phosphorylase [Rhinatrema bivittatum]|uniref:thymidine phosphorylase n=1 Tax=Rhinatrema bivittatum TaxID=194408 RepID=UPI0011284DF0|nr:thymidine phosphorylase [Rhinatrema bivittatum]XP_029472786.1 thymidine phosphorylase [Rhinatrema bivittatum]